MRYVLTKETTVEQFNAMLEQLSKEERPNILFEGRKPVDWSQFCGKVTFEEDGMEYQNRMRDEWDR